MERGEGRRERGEGKGERGDVIKVARHRRAAHLAIMLSARVIIVRKKTERKKVTGKREDGDRGERKEKMPHATAER
jgi:hypothetical protein